MLVYQRVSFKIYDATHVATLGCCEDQVDPIIQEMFDPETFSRGLELQDAKLPETGGFWRPKSPCVFCVNHSIS